jgi:D-alanyl-D-alanine carboxypeptidase
MTKLKIKPILLSFLIVGVFVSVATLLILLALEKDNAKPQSSNPKPQDLPKIKLNPIPVTKNIPAPQVTARNIFILDRNSKMVLYNQEASQRVYPASTTKMMTALVALDTFDLDRKLEVPSSFPDGQNISLQKGQILSVEQLLYAMLVQSANDAAEVLAYHHPLGRIGFVQAMNKKAADYHLNDTQFKNPTGLDEPGHYSSAVDLVRLADVGLRNSEFARIVSIETAVVGEHVVSNVNQLLGKIPGVKGVKTGYTEGAGQALITFVERDGHGILIATLGSTDRFKDTKDLIDWVYTNFEWVEPR